jgi:hypothetical protein
MQHRTLRASTIAVACIALVVLAGCAAGDARFTAESPAGFWIGLWHGAISLVTLVVGIFTDAVRMYEPHNTGGWYDFGFLVGATCIWGAGSHRAGRKSRRDAEWEEIGRKVEAKLKRMIRRWAEAEPDEDWRVVEEKAERKLKQKLREWAEESHDGGTPTLPD